MRGRHGSATLDASPRPREVTVLEQRNKEAVRRFVDRYQTPATRTPSPS